VCVEEEERAEKHVCWIVQHTRFLLLYSNKYDDIGSNKNRNDYTAFLGECL